MSQKKSQNNIYWSALWESLLVALLTILPTIFISFSIVFDSETTKTFSDYYKSGEFFLYGVSFSSSAFLIYQSKQKNWSYFHLILIFLASTSYAVILNAKKPNIETISIWSTLACVISFVFFYIAQVYSNKLSKGIDVREVSNNQITDIQDGLE